MNQSTNKRNWSPGGQVLRVTPPATAARTLYLEVRNLCFDDNDAIETQTNFKKTNSSSDAFLSMKHRSLIGTWNVRTLFEAGKIHQAAKEARRLQLDILGMSECRWNGNGETTLATGEKFLYSGRDENDVHRDGVGILLSKAAIRSLIEWRPVSERILWARFKTKARNVSIVQVYAPTEVSDEGAKDTFYSQLLATVHTIPTGDILMVMGDFNAKIGDKNEGIEHIMGKQGLGPRNDNGERLIGFCNAVDLTIGGSLFQHKKGHKVTWVSPDGVTTNQIDHFCISRSWRGSLRDVRVKKSADIGSDHHLLCASLRLKIVAIKRQQNHVPKLALGRLKNEETCQNFLRELRNQYSITNTEDDSIESKWTKIKTCFTNAGRNAIGPQPKNMKPWMSENTWKLIDERRNAKCQRDSALTRAQKQNATLRYSELNKAVKKSCRRDKRRAINALAQEAEAAAEARDTRKLYETTRKLAGHRFRQNRPIRSSTGVLLTSNEQQLARWKEHFEYTVNCASSADILQVPSAEPSSPVGSRLSSQPPSLQEITEAICELKSGKSPGSDGIPAELLKADPVQTAEMLLPLISQIWEEERIPNDWLSGTLIKIPKKGDLSLCSNYRGIMLLSIPSKILTKLLLTRINRKVEPLIRKQQAGFRPNRSCIDQINTLRIIIEQFNEFQSSDTNLYMTFIDYKTAFDSVARDSIWAALRRRGVAPKFIRLVKAQYEDFKCRVLHNGIYSESFSSTSGVRQGCLLSPILFLIVLDDVLSQAMDKEKRGIEWNFRRLEDLDYADDLCLLSQKHSDMQNKIDDLNRASKSAGLTINRSKTKTMSAPKKELNNQFTIEGERIEHTSNFCYLGSIITPEGGATEDVDNRISKAKAAFGQLKKVWKSTAISTNTKLKIFRSNVKSVLLYGCETWLMTKSLVNKLQVFVNRCLRQILRIWWPRIISNSELLSRCEEELISIQVRRRKWKWIGHTLRKQVGEPPRDALNWNPQGARNVGRPRTSWRRTLEDEIKSTGKSWNQVKAIAKNRESWRKFVEALCSTEE